MGGDSAGGVHEQLGKNQDKAAAPQTLPRFIYPDPPFHPLPLLPYALYGVIIGIRHVWSCVQYVTYEVAVITCLILELRGQVGGLSCWTLHCICIVPSRNFQMYETYLPPQRQGWLVWLCLLLRLT
jgi:hypothetical protein